ncbi:MAG: hypothetical protein WAM21_11775 [Steroidobacteraceae bacterium]
MQTLGGLDAGDDAVGLRGSEQLSPLVISGYGKGVYVPRRAGPTEDRRGDAAYDHRRNSGRLEPPREIGERGNKESRNSLLQGKA